MNSMSCHFLRRPSKLTSALIGLGLAIASAKGAVVAGNYALLQLGGSEDGIMDIDSNSVVTGNIGKASSSSGNELKLSSSTINGDVSYEAGVGFSQSSSTITGMINSGADLSQAVTDANTLSSSTSGLTATQTISIDLDSTTDTITGNGGLNVIDVTGDFILNSSATLQLDGTANDIFMFNISSGSEFKVNSNSSITLLNGVATMNVLFNVEGTGPDIDVSGSTLQGTLLAVDRNVGVSGGSTVNGAIFAGRKLELSDVEVNGDPFCPVPEPSTALLAGLFTISTLRRRR